MAPSADAIDRSSHEANGLAALYGFTKFSLHADERIVRGTNATMTLSRNEVSKLE
jgi:hypothetical protein